MNWQGTVERTVVGLGYDLVDADKSAGGLLRVYIDHPAAGDTQGGERFITVDDCEKVTRQLQHVLEVDGVAYERLEVSSPGLDRPLRKAADFARFVGDEIELTLKLPFQGRKKFRGALQAHGDGWRLVLAPAAAPKRSAKRAASEATAPDTDTVLDFSFDEVREARLVPVVDFKGRRFQAPVQSTEDEFEGGRVQ